jgi:hypothetical protein
VKQAADAAMFDTQLFSETLSCDLVLPAAFLPDATPAPAAQAESLLLALAQVEDLRGEDATEDKESSAAVQRVNAKLDLMLALLGRLVRQSMQMPAPRAVRWSARGLRLELPASSGVAAGVTGMVALQASDWLPDRLELPATVLGEAELEPGRHALWLAFPALTAGLGEALERHLFRLHRRQIAESRRR